MGDPVLDWSELNLTDAANAFLLMVTAVITYVAVAIGRREKKPPLPETETTISGAAIISDKAVMAFAGSVEALNMEMAASRKTAIDAAEVARKAAEALAAVQESAANKLVQAQDKAAEKLSRSQDGLRETIMDYARDNELLRQELRTLTLQMAQQLALRR